ncbi:MAG: hypothetical protein OEZ06_17435 [Myxococcales bacterium]|nr:hypothetical protein [Myxococcales bacterium]
MGEVLLRRLAKKSLDQQSFEKSGVPAHRGEYRKAGESEQDGAESVGHGDKRYSVN